MVWDTYGKNIWNGVAITPYFFGSLLASQMVFWRHFDVSSPILLETSEFIKLNTLLLAIKLLRIPLRSALLPSAAPGGLVNRMGTTNTKRVAMRTKAPKITWLAISIPPLPEER